MRLHDSVTGFGLPPAFVPFWLLDASQMPIGSWQGCLLEVLKDPHNIASAVSGDSAAPPSGGLLDGQDAPTRPQDASKTLPSLLKTPQR